MGPPRIMIAHARYAILGQESQVQKPIEIEVWKPNPGKPGYLRFERIKEINEVFDELKERLKEEKLIPDEYFLITKSVDYIPHDYWRIISFATKGSSEGHYIHVGYLQPGGRYQDLFHGKTLREGPDGLDYALKIANACTRAFEG